MNRKSIISTFQECAEYGYLLRKHETDMQVFKFALQVYDFLKKHKDVEMEEATSKILEMTSGNSPVDKLRRAA